jgi:hypothetical protein
MDTNLKNRGRNGHLAVRRSGGRIVPGLAMTVAGLCLASLFGAVVQMFGPESAAGQFGAPVPVTTPWARAFLRSTNGLEGGGWLQLPITNLVGGQVITNFETDRIVLTNRVGFLNEFGGEVVDNNGNPIFYPGGTGQGATIYDNSGQYAIAVLGRELWEGTYPANEPVLNWATGDLIDSNGVEALNWFHRTLSGNWTLSGTTLYTNYYVPGPGRILAVTAPLQAANSSAMFTLETTYEVTNYQIGGGFTNIVTFTDDLGLQTVTNIVFQITGLGEYGSGALPIVLSSSTAVSNTVQMSGTFAGRLMFSLIPCGNGND